MTELGLGLFEADHYEDALSVQETDLATMRRIGASEENILTVQQGIANSYESLGRNDDSLRMEKAIYASRVRLSGAFHEKTLISALNLSITLVRANKACESMAFSRPLLPMSRRALGADHEITLRFAHSYAYAACNCAAASRDEVVFADKLLEDTIRRFRRVLGTAHPSTSKAEGDLFYLRERLANL